MHSTKAIEMPWTGAPDQQAALHKALQELHEKGVTDVALADEISRFRSGFAERHPAFKKARLGRSTICRWRNGKSSQEPDYYGRGLLFTFLEEKFEAYPTVAFSKLLNRLHPAKAEGDHQFFHSFVQHYQVHKHRTTRFNLHMVGRYKFFHYSEAFNNYSHTLPCAIVIGQFALSFDEGSSAIVVEETQAYNTKSLGKKQAMKELNTGYCFGKGPNFYFVMKEKSRETPKFYVFSRHYYDPDTHKLQHMSGYMLKGSYEGDYFHSPVYVLRDEDNEVECNILPCSQVPDNIIEELNKDRVILRAERNRPPATY